MNKLLLAILIWISTAAISGNSYADAALWGLLGRSGGYVLYVSIESAEIDGSTISATIKTVPDGSTDYFVTAYQVDCLTSVFRSPGGGMYNRQGHFLIQVLSANTQWSQVVTGTPAAVVYKGLCKAWRASKGR